MTEDEKRDAKEWVRAHFHSFVPNYPIRAMIERTKALRTSDSGDENDNWADIYCSPRPDYTVYDPATQKISPIVIADPEAEKERLWQLVVQVSR